MILKILDFFIDKLFWLNPVEWLKEGVTFIFFRKKTSKEKIQIKRNLLELFVFFKWLLLFIGFYFNVQMAFIIWYLIISNLFTYFYYHLWNVRDSTNSNSLSEYYKGRFSLLLQSILFSNFSFAYLYKVVYPDCFEWNYLSIKSSIWLSFSNSLASTNYTDAKSISIIGSDILMIQLIISFVFISILLSTSLQNITPKINNN